jgi:hypothetical protein
VVLPYLHLRTAVAGRSPKLAREGKPVAKNHACSARTMSPSDMTLELRGMTIPWHNNHNGETGELKGGPTVTHDPLHHVCRVTEKKVGLGEEL